MSLIKFIAVVSAILWLFGYLQYAFMQAVAESLSFDLRTRYLNQLLKQEVAFFEGQQIEALPSQIAEYFETIREGVGEKIGRVAYAVSMFVSSMVIAFSYGPYFALMCFAYLPIFFLAGAFFGRAAGAKQGMKLKQNKELGAHTEEALSAIKLI